MDVSATQPHIRPTSKWSVSGCMSGCARSALALFLIVMVLLVVAVAGLWMILSPDDKPVDAQPVPLTERTDFEMMSTQLPEIQATIDALEAEIAVAQTEQTDLMAELETLQNEATVLTEQIAQLDPLVANYSVVKADLEAQLTTLNGEIVALQSQVPVLTARRDSLIAERDGINTQIEVLTVTVEGLNRTLDATSLQAEYMQPTLFYPFAGLPEGTRLISSEHAAAEYGFKAVEGVQPVKGFYLYEVARNSQETLEPSPAVTLCGQSVHFFYDWTNGQPTTVSAVAVNREAFKRGREEWYPQDWADLIKVIDIIEVKESDILSGDLPEGIDPAYVKTRVFLLVEVENSWRLTEEFCPVS